MTAGRKFRRAETRLTPGPPVAGISTRKFMVRNARSKIQNFLPGAVLMDIASPTPLPDLNGRQLADRITRLRPAVKVVFMTGYARNAIVHHSALDPEVDLLAKPFTVDSLGRKLRQVIARG
jgi:CheY-like chemotaxis protein